MPKEAQNCRVPTRQQLKEVQNDGNAARPRHELCIGKHHLVTTCARAASFPTIFATVGSHERRLVRVLGPSETCNFVDARLRAIFWGLFSSGVAHIGSSEPSLSTASGSRCHVTKRAIARVTQGTRLLFSEKA